MRSAIWGTGHYVPDKVVTNADLGKLIPGVEEWIESRSGIRERRYVDLAHDPALDGAEMGARAAKQALEMAGLTIDDIDFVIWGTLSPDKLFPGNSAFGGPKLGLKPGTPAMDIRNQCSFFIYALTMADALIKAGTYRRILVIGSEIHSTALDFSERGKDVAVLFGDGAGAIVMGPAQNDTQGLLATDLHSDGKYAGELMLPAGSATPGVWMTEEVIARGGHFPRMNGKLVFKHAVTKMPVSVRATLEKAGATLADVDLFISHQANLRIVEYVQKSLELPDDKIYNNIQRYGNTTAASIPIALDESVRAGKLKRGQLLCVAAFGAGFTWGSALLRF